MAVTPAHLSLTLSHPLLFQMFSNFCEDNETHKSSLSFYIAAEAYLGTFDQDWLEIQGRFLYAHYLKQKRCSISPGTLQSIENNLKQGQISKLLFQEAVGEIFDRVLAPVLTSFLQSDMYSVKYENLCKGFLFVDIRDGVDLMNTRGMVYCSITIGDLSISSSCSSPQMVTWKEEDPIHKLEIIPQKEDVLMVTVFARNQSCWKEDIPLGSAHIRLEDIWDETPREMWFPIQKVEGGISNLEPKVQIGVVLIHRPAEGINIGEVDFSNPLATSCSYGHFGAAKRLLAEGYPIDSQMEESKRTALHIAVLKNRQKITQLLLSKNADPNIVDYHSMTPLHLAAQFAPNLCQLLVAAGARVDTKELFHNGQTPLHMLATHNYVQALEYLIVKGADINAQTLEGVTPLHKALSQKSTECIKMLVRKKANLKIKDADGNSPWMIVNELKKSSPAYGRDLFKFMKQFTINAPPVPIRTPPQGRTTN